MHIQNSVHLLYSHKEKKIDILAVIKNDDQNRFKSVFKNNSREVNPSGLSRANIACSSKKPTKKMLKHIKRVNTGTTSLKSSIVMPNPLHKCVTNITHLSNSVITTYTAN